MGQLMFKEDESLKISARCITHIIEAWNGKLSDQVDAIQNVDANTAYGNRSEQTIKRQVEQYLEVWSSRIKPQLTDDKLYAADTFEMKRRLVGIQSEYIAAVTKASKSFVKFSEAVDKNEPKMAEIVTETEAIYLKMFDIDFATIIDSASNKRNRVLQQLPEQPTFYFWGNVLRGNNWTYNNIIKRFAAEYLDKQMQADLDLVVLRPDGMRMIDPKNTAKLAEFLMTRGMSGGNGYLISIARYVQERIISELVIAQINNVLVPNDAAEQLKRVAHTKLKQATIDNCQKKLKKYVISQLPQFIADMGYYG